MIEETSCGEILQDIADELVKVKREMQFLSLRIEQIRENIRQTMFLKMKDEENGDNEEKEDNGKNKSD
jgi:pimeloyl-CoA synthetase